MVVFIPKPRRTTDQTKSLKSIGLMSFVPKTVENILDLYKREGVLASRPIHRTQHAYRAVHSTELALFQMVRRPELTIEMQRWASF